MDVILLVSLASGIIVLICIILLLKQRNTAEIKPVRAPAQPRAQEGQLPRRVAVARNARTRLRAAAHQHNESDEDEHVEEIEFPDGKLGTKKRAKLEAKAERKAQREVEERDREDRKRKEELEEGDRLKAEEKTKQEKEKQLEEELKAREEKERQEHEEYLKMIKSFNVEEEGYDEDEDAESEENVLQEFINYIKKMKVVVLEDLAANFKLKTQNVIDRIQHLQAEGALTGVVDDRGKFIYISEEELASVAKFVKQRGRVSIAELAESSNQLINLNPSQTVAVKN